MRLSLSDEEMVQTIIQNERASVQAAAYTIYFESTKGKPLSPREFHVKFADNWEVFMKLELEQPDQ